MSTQPAARSGVVGGVLRVAWLGLLVGCASAAPPTPASKAGPRWPGCDVSIATSSSRRAWLRGAADPATVLEVRDDRVQVGYVATGLVVTRWVPRSELRRVVSLPTAISHRPGGPPDEGVFVLPGFPVEPVTTPWVPVTASSLVPVEGFVPTSATAWFYEQAPAAPDPTTDQEIRVRTAPRADAPERAVLQRGAKVRIGAEVAPGWFAVTGSGAFTRVSGFAVSPPPAPLRRHGSFDFSDIEIEGRLVSPSAPVGTCLRETPGGAIAGAIIGPTLTTPVTNGGTMITVDAPWGKATYYVDPPPRRN